jgi:uncharacterized protein YggE
MMSKKMLVLFPLALLLLTAAACTSKTTVNNVPADTSGVTVSGHGEFDAPPDTGYVDVGVQVTAPNVANARDGAATAADAVIGSLKSNGIDEKDIQTTNYNIQPMYDYSKNGGQPTITGYQVTNTVQAKVRKLDSFSKVIDDATAAGGNNVRVQSIRFGVEDDVKAKEQAREKAVADAKTKAEQLAKLSGVTLGKAISISESNASQPNQPIYARDAAAAAGTPATPIQPGTSTISVDVSIRWAVQ